jgi:hypothetical protein
LNYFFSLGNIDQFECDQIPLPKKLIKTKLIKRTDDNFKEEFDLEEDGGLKSINKLIIQILK